MTSSPTRQPPARLTVYAPAAFSDILHAVAEHIEAALSVAAVLTLAPVAGTSPDTLVNRLGRGERADIVIAPVDVLERLMLDGTLARSALRVVMRSSIAMAVRAGEAKPDISTLAALERTLKSAGSIALSAAGSGAYLVNQAFPAMQLTDVMATKSRVITDEPVGAVVARGEADLGFQQLSELLPIPGLDIVGLLPEGAQKTTVLAAWTDPAAAQGHAASAWIDALSTEAAAQVLRRGGVEPA